MILPRRGVSCHSVTLPPCCPAALLPCHPAALWRVQVIFLNAGFILTGMFEQNSVKAHLAVSAAPRKRRAGAPRAPSRRPSRQQTPQPTADAPADSRRPSRQPTPQPTAHGPADSRRPSRQPTAQPTADAALPPTPRARASAPAPCHAQNLHCNLTSNVFLAHHFYSKLIGEELPGCVVFTSSSASYIPVRAAELAHPREVAAAPRPALAPPRDC